MKTQAHEEPEKFHKGGKVKKKKKKNSKTNPNERALGRMAGRVHYDDKIWFESDFSD